MDGIPLKRRRSLFTEVNPSKCIICQKTTQQPTSSTGDGRKRIKEASNIRNDEVTERLTRVESDKFVYHVSNECYKNYTHKTVLEKIQRNALNTSSEKNECIHKSDTPRQSRSNVKARQSVSTPDVRPTKKTCIVCGQYKNKGDYEKYRISESDRARKFIEAAVYYQDNVYTRTCDLQDVNAVFGADLFYHNNCMRKYVKNYEDESKRCRLEPQSNSVKRIIFIKLLSEIDERLQNGEGFVLSELREKLNKQLHSESSLFSNRELRLLLYNHYGSDICFSCPKEANKSAIVFMKTVTAEDVVDSLCSTDVIEQCANTIRQSLLETDFDLCDKFCDATDLNESWTNTLIPEPLLRFFGVLFNFEPKSFYDCNASDTDHAEDDHDSECVKLNENVISDKKRKKVEALHQILYFNVHNGSKRTPLHIMNAQAIHEKCKSRELITSFNHYGLAISYNELQRYHNDVASLIVETSRGHVPLPSHFDPHMFTIAAFDNFDHDESTLSGIQGSHDTVSVLFQEKPDSVHRKPRISETNTIHGSKVFQQQLQCQNLLEYTKPAKKPNLPDDYTVHNDLYAADEELEANVRKLDIAWTLARMNISEAAEGTIKPNNQSQIMPSWSAFNSVISGETVKQKIVGFLPVIPSPVTEYQTVYTALKNFQDILTKLDQVHLAITCDEGVYHIAREITMANPTDFSVGIISHDEDLSRLHWQIPEEQWCRMYMEGKLSVWTKCSTICPLWYELR